MNERLELAMAMLAIFLSAVFLLSLSFYMERGDTPTHGAGSTRQAGLRVRLISRRDPYMRSER